MEGGSGDWHYLFTSCLELTVEVDFIIGITRIFIQMKIATIFTMMAVLDKE